MVKTKNSLCEILLKQRAGFCVIIKDQVFLLVGNRDGYPAAHV